MNPKIKVEEISSYERKLTVEIPEALIAQEIDQQVQVLASRSSLKGFRQGKAPVQVIKMQFRGQVVREVISSLIEKTYEEALREHHLFAVCEPDIQAPAFEEGKPFRYTATLEVKPQLEIKNYTGLSLAKEKMVVDEKRVNTVLEELQNSRAELKPILEDRVVRDKDFVVMDFEGLLEGKTFPGGAAQNFLYEVGSHRFMEDFEKGLRGMKSGEQKEILTLFPNDFHEEKLAGKEVLFKVSIREIKGKELPKLDDTFAKEFLDSQSLENLKDKIKEDLLRRNEDQVKKDLENQALKHLVEKHPFTPPPSLVHRQYVFLIEDAKYELKRLGLSQKEKIDEQLKAMEQTLKEKADFDVKGILLLEAIAKKEGLAIQEEELNQRLEKIAKAGKTSVSALKDYYQKKGALSQIRFQLLQEKTLEMLVSKAKIKENK